MPTYEELHGAASACGVWREPVCQEDLGQSLLPVPLHKLPQRFLSCPHHPLGLAVGGWVGWG